MSQFLLRSWAVVGMGAFVGLIWLAGCGGPSTPGICEREFQTATPDFGTSEPETKHVPGELLVQFDAVATLEKMNLFNQQIAEALGAVIDELAPELRMQTVRFNTDLPVVEAIAAVRALAGADILNVVEPNYRFGLQVMPNDPDFPKQYGLFNEGQTGGCTGADISAPMAWDVEKGRSEVVVAVIDSGIDYTHPDLAANIWTNEDEIPDNGVDDDHNGYVDDVRGWNFADENNNPMDDNKHGTHVAGILGAVGNNGQGIAGVCWNVRLMPLKFIGADGSGDTDAAIRAIRYAVANGARILSNSWGSTSQSRALEEAIKAADEAGAIFIAAAGNSGMNNDKSTLLNHPNYPSTYPLPNVVAVAASADNDALASFTNYGRTSVDLAAPGVDIYSTVPGGGYETLSGTSMATPFVSGVAALLWSNEPGLSHHEVIQRILDTVDPAPRFDRYLLTGGRLNAWAALAGSRGKPGARSWAWSFSPGLR